MARLRRPKLLLVPLVLLLVFALLEGGLRLAGYAQGPVLYFDEDVGYRLFPNQERAMRSQGVRVEFRSNALGYRGPVYDGPRDPGVLRIACLGDSYTWGLGVHGPETYPVRLGELLSPAVGAGRVEVMNFGFPGYNTTNELNCYRKVVRPLAPDIVVLGVTPEDIRPADPGLRHSDALPFRLFWWTATYDAFNRHLRGRFRLFRPPVQAAGPTRLRSYRDDPLALQKNPTTDRARPYWDVMVGAIADLAAEVEADGAQLVVVCMPARWQVNPLRVARASGKPPAALAAMHGDLTTPQAHLKQRLAPLGVSPVDLFEAFVAARFDPFDSFAPGHPGARANRMMAEEIAHALRDQGVLAPWGASDDVEAPGPPDSSGGPEENPPRLR